MGDLTSYSDGDLITNLLPRPGSDKSRELVVAAGRERGAV